jgi:single-strand DNA-binding protein
MKLLTIIGNIGKDAAVKENNGKKQLMFSVAVNDNYKDAQGNKVERTDWITVFSNQLTLSPYLLKGTKVFVQGNTSSRIYLGDDRQQRIGTSINAQIIQLLSNKKEGVVAGADGGALPEGGETGGAPDDDLPF